MLYIEEVQKCPEWRPEMEHWLVRNISLHPKMIGNIMGTKQCVVLQLHRENKDTLKFEDVTLSFSHESCGSGLESSCGFANDVSSIIELDLRHCPQGVSLVWNESEEMCGCGV